MCFRYYIIGQVGKYHEIRQQHHDAGDIRHAEIHWYVSTARIVNLYLTCYAINCSYNAHTPAFYVFTHYL